jgi:DNA polymerase-3 subunit epsilon
MIQPLAETEVLVVDCQSTGANPGNGSLLEVGWMRTNASTVAGEDSAPVEAHLVQLPRGERLPPQVARLTGIRYEELRAAVPPERAWERLAEAAGEVGRGCRRPAAPTVVHFARFEAAFLLALHETCEPEGTFPLDFVCTHEIARRLFPDLPRRGLRALAGYFGFPLGQLRRSAEHVAATAFVWRHLVASLGQECGVQTLQDLHRWFDEAPPRTARRRIYPMPREKRLALPDQPGVYRMLRRSGDVLYVGKATSLRRRVNSYFQKQTRIPERTLEMLTQARDVSVTVTESYLEAALLETDEIKERSPPYNVALRPEDRAVWFSSTDFSDIGPTPCDARPLGPLPSRESGASIATLHRLLGLLGRARLGPVSRETCGTVLGVPAKWAPEPACFAAGLERFRTEHLEPLGVPGPCAQKLRRLGTELWQSRLEQADRACLDEGLEVDRGESVAGSGPAEEPSWDPTRVAEALNVVVMRAGHLIRRGRWLCRLSDSVLAWQEPGASAGRRLLVLGRGGIVERRGVPPGRDAPTPPGAGRSLRERQRCFDVSTYDRLRVLSTELKRLVVDSENVELRFGPHRVLTRAGLAKVLRWV